MTVEISTADRLTRNDSQTISRSLGSNAPISRKASPNAAPNVLTARLGRGTLRERPQYWQTVAYIDRNADVHPSLAKPSHKYA